MSEKITIIAKLALSGFKKALELTRQITSEAIKELGKDTSLEVLDTAYNIPSYHIITGKKLEKLGDVPKVLDELESKVLRKPILDKMYLGKELTVENALEAGLATLILADIIETIKYVRTPKPYKPPYTGFLSDSQIRALGVSLASGKIPGIVVVLGKASTDEIAGKIGKEIQSSGMLGLLIGPVVEQMEKAGVRIGAEYNLIPLGDTVTSAVHAANVALRAPTIFGGLKPGDIEKIRKYIKERVPAFVIALGPLDDLTVAAGAGVIAIGLPVLTDQPVPEIPEALIPVKPEEAVSKGCELRGIKIKPLKLEIPIAYGPVFEGKAIRKHDMYVEFGGGRSPAFELAVMKPLEEVKDGKIEVIGPEIDEMEEGKAHPLGIVVYVAGKKMKKEYEPIIERRIHEYINYGEDTWHIGSRDICWIRISKEGYRKGFKIRHFGVILYTMIKKDFSAIVDKVQVKLITDRDEVLKAREEAKKFYAERDRRIAAITDESVDVFYSCTLCQSFAPNHVCIITPERPGLCGAVTYLDAKASHELQPEGPNQPVPKGKCLDPVKGEWEGVNKFVYEASHHATKRYHLYSALTYPVTSCGCFECVLVASFEANGFIIIPREYTGENPIGLRFSTLAGMIGGGKQAPGTVGICKKYIVSRKFFKADGGIKRVVWMPKSLKEELKEGIIKRGEEEGVPDLYDKIADETVAKTMDELLEYLKKVDHPALKMTPLEKLMEYPG